MAKENKDFVKKVAKEAKKRAILDQEKKESQRVEVLSEAIVKKLYPFYAELADNINLDIATLTRIFSAISVNIPEVKLEDSKQIKDLSGQVKALADKLAVFESIKSLMEKDPGKTELADGQSVAIEGPVEVTGSVAIEGLQDLVDKIPKKLTGKMELDVAKNMSPDRYIPVRLTNGFEFKGLGGGGGGGTVIDTSALATNEKLQEVIDALGTIDITADTINLNTDGLEAKLDTLIAGLNPLEKYAGLYAQIEDATYLYIAKEAIDGSYVLIREELATGIRLYDVGASDVASGWTGRASADYQLFSSKF